ncbi:MAG TPA: hypothetical protein VF717_09525, partial [Pyrinomonadaceae bacterium]
PVIAEVLGIKRHQIEGVREPNADLVEKLAVDGDHIRRLAETYLSYGARRTQQPLPINAEPATHNVLG